MGEWLSTVDPAVFWIVGVAAIILVWLVSRASRDAQSGEPGGEPVAAAEATQAGMRPELVAIITAAVACSRGSQAGAFRVTAIGQVQGFQTPVWGHIDRASYQTGTNVVR